MLDSIEPRKARLHQLVDSIPAERLDAAEDLLESLWGEPQTVRLGGLWRNQGIEITEENITEAR